MKLDLKITSAPIESVVVGLNEAEAIRAFKKWLKSDEKEFKAIKCTGQLIE